MQITTFGEIAVEIFEPRDRLLHRLAEAQEMSRIADDALVESGKRVRLPARCRASSGNGPCQYGLAWFSGLWIWVCQSISKGCLHVQNERLYYFGAVELLASDELFQRHQRCGGRRYRAVDDALKLLAVGRIDFQSALLCIRKELRICDGLVERIPQ